MSLPYVAAGRLDVLFWTSIRSDSLVASANADVHRELLDLFRAAWTPALTGFPKRLSRAT